jgi:hypothetical protein
VAGAPNSEPSSRDGSPKLVGAENPIRAVHLDFPRGHRASKDGPWRCPFSTWRSCAYSSDSGSAAGNETNWPSRL